MTLEQAKRIMADCPQLVSLFKEDGPIWVNGKFSRDELLAVLVIWKYEPELFKEKE